MSNANPYQPKTYTNVQLIAYQVPTLRLTQPQPALPAPTDDAIKKLTDPDARNRVQRLLGVLNWARSTIPAHIMHFDHPLAQSDTLKIFMAPEFYFRPSAQGYSWNTMLQILECLKTVVRQDTMLDDWLIVPGTICSWQEIKPGGSKTFLNTAGVIKGGHPNAPFTFVHKQQRSNIDNVPANMTDAPLDPNFAKSLGTWDEQKSRMFEIDNIMFGLDVCLDHHNKALKTVCLQWPNHEGHAAPPIDVHLITSCGMQIKPPSVAARTNGCVLLSDGSPASNSVAGWRQSTVQRVTAGNMTNAGQATLSDQNATNTVNFAAPAWQQAVPNNLAIARGNVANADWFAQRVVCYPPFPL